MKRLALLLAGGLAASGLIFSQGTDDPAAIASRPKVDLKGTIQSVQLGRGQGAPTLVVKTADATVNVVLGSMRYLMEQDFNPKAGVEVSVHGFQVNSRTVYAISLTLLPGGRTLKLRDEQGWPLWQRGRRGRGGQRGW
ncbi:MAG: hypothetical protein IT159_08835 [Bryobacterales bacterium]|nr:hypothetical protein [Bryobacterales bacterium]